MILNKTDLEKLPSRYRALLINSLAGAKQACLIGTKNKTGQSNLAIFNSLIHIGANPPLWGFICRPNTVERHTLNNILEHHYYTINYVATNKYKQAHQTSAKYAQQVSEFEACGFVEAYKENFYAPFVQDAIIQIGMKFMEQVNIEINGTIMLIGSIEQVTINTAVTDDGFVQLSQANVLACCGLDAYLSTTLLGRLSYAKPNEESKPI